MTIKKIKGSLLVFSTNCHLIQLVFDMVITMTFWINRFNTFVIVAGIEKTPMVRGEENGGRLVYMYEPKSCFVSESLIPVV
jgi:hypothetical protein